MLGGLCLVLLSAVGAPSFWYVPCAYALPVLGLVWAWRPRVAAGLSVGPLASVIGLIRYLPGLWLACGIVCLLTAILIVIVAAKDSHGIWVPLVASLAFVSASFLVDRLFTNKVLIRPYQVQVALDGQAPWGEVGPEWSDETKPIVLYRRVGDTYCYIAFKSAELRDRLATRNGSSVSMQINIFKDFGNERGYNVRSVDGLVLADGQKVVKDAERFGGQILGPANNSSASCW